MRPTMQRVRKTFSDKDATGYLAEMQEFVAAVAEGRKPVTSAEDGRRDLEIIVRSYDSLYSGSVTAVENFEHATPSIA